MDDLYRENVLDHYHNPRNKGRLEQPDISYRDSNPLCGDVVRIDISVEEGRVKDVRFDGEGCAISLASASMLTEAIQGKSLEELKEFGKEEMLDLVSIPLGPVRIKCALLPLKALKAGAYGLKGWPGEEDEWGG